MLGERDKLATATQTPGTRKGTPAATQKTALDAVERVLDTVKKSLEDSKAEEIVTINIQGKSSLGDYMVIASGRSQRHVGAIADHLIRALKSANAGTPRVEGLQSADWVLIDADDIIVHLFRPEVREFYNLEKMWQMPASQDVN